MDEALFQNLWFPEEGEHNGGKENVVVIGKVVISEVNKLITVCTNFEFC